MTEDALLDRLTAERTPAWTLRVMLAAMRERGWSFDTAWYSATQRLRVQPSMSADDVDELIAFKGWFEWSKPLWEWAYVRGALEVRPTLLDGEIFGAAETRRAVLAAAAAPTTATTPARTNGA